MAQEDEFTFFRTPHADWWTILKGTWRQMSQDNLSALSAGAAYYALTTLFPALAALVSVYGLVTNPQTLEHQVEGLSGVLPAESLGLVKSWLQDLIKGGTGKFGIGLVIGVFLAWWSAWSATSMLMTAINICYREPERRSFLRFNLEAVVLGAVLALCGAIGLVLIAIPPLAIGYFELTGPWTVALSLARWPILALISVITLALIYRYSPSSRPRRWEWISWGATIATALWLIVSAGFSFYVSKFGNYDRTYGSVGAVVVMLLWMHLSAYVVLLGAELNAELERHANKP